MDTARIFAELSHARRLHVGAIVVKDDRIISIGYNGMPAGWDNNCEEKIWMTEQEQDTYHPDKINKMYPFYGEREVGEGDRQGQAVARRLALVEPQVHPGVLAAGPGHARPAVGGCGLGHDGLGHSLVGWLLAKPKPKHEIDVGCA